MMKMRKITIDLSNSPYVVNSYAGEIGENNAVTLEVIPEQNDGVICYRMIYAVDGGIYPSKEYEAADVLEIPITSELTLKEELTCQLVGYSEDRKSLICKSPIIKLYLGESLQGEIVDPDTGENFAEEIHKIETTITDPNTEAYYDFTQMENINNKKTVIESSDTDYPTSKAVMDYIKQSDKVIEITDANGNSRYSYYELNDKINKDGNIYTIKGSIVAGTMTVDGRGYLISFELNPTGQQKAVNNSVMLSAYAWIVEIGKAPTYQSATDLPPNAQVKDNLARSVTASNTLYPSNNAVINYVTTENTKQSEELYTIVKSTDELINYYTKSQSDVKLATKQDTLTAGDNVKITGSTVSVDLSAYAKSADLGVYATQTYVQDEIQTAIYDVMEASY
jgi:hypothetical protein